MDASALIRCITPIGSLAEAGFEAEAGCEAVLILAEAFQEEDVGDIVELQVDKMSFSQNSVARVDRVGIPRLAHNWNIVVLLCCDGRAFANHWSIVALFCFFAFWRFCRESQCFGVVSRKRPDGVRLRLGHYHLQAKFGGEVLQTTRWRSFSTSSASPSCFTP